MNNLVTNKVGDSNELNQKKPDEVIEMQESMDSTSQNQEGGFKDLNPATIMPNNHEDHVKQLQEVILKKTESYDPAITGKESEFANGDRLTLSTLIFKYATCGDKCAMISACLASIAFGAAMPLLMVLFGDLSDSIGNT